MRRSIRALAGATILTAVVTVHEHDGRIARRGERAGAIPCNNNNVTWQVGSSATVGTATSFVGNVLANRSTGAGGKASPTLTTTPSGSVPAGGGISDTAQVIGGAAPTGSVTFTLFGPGDTTCNPAAARP